MTISMLGWMATAIFAASYLFRKAGTLTKIQAAAACLWIIYGLAIGAVPVVVANLIVAGAALYSSFRRPPTRACDASTRTTIVFTEPTCPSSPCTQGTLNEHRNDA